MNVKRVTYKPKRWYVDSANYSGFVKAVSPEDVSRNVEAVVQLSAAAIILAFMDYIPRWSFIIRRDNRVEARLKHV